MRARDVVTVALDRAVRVLKVLAFAERRGSADDARECVNFSIRWMAVGPSRQSRRAFGSQAGRPTKRDRRATALHR